MIAIAVATSVVLGGQPTGRFVPDWTFKGSALTGMQQIGQVTWRAENGEIIGTPQTPEGGWLLLDREYQDRTVRPVISLCGGLLGRCDGAVREDADGHQGHLYHGGGGERGSIGGHGR